MIKLNREWKQGLSLEQYVPFVMKVSLWDLLFYTKNGKTHTRFLEQSSDNFKITGLELSHNVIIFDTVLYSTENLSNPALSTSAFRTINKSFTEGDGGVPFEQWEKNGFDLAIPVFDGRAKALYLTSNNVATYIKGANEQNFAEAQSFLKPKKLTKTDLFYNTAQDHSNWALGFKIFDRDSLLLPTTSRDCYLRSVLFDESAIGTLGWNEYQNTYKVALENDFDGSSQLTADIILGNRDTTFEKRFLAETPYLSAYNTICLNYKSLTVWKNLLKFYNCGGTINNYTDIITVSGTEVTINPVYEFLIKNCFVWLKCAFFGDYIDYKDFNQSLNQDSSVVHSNLMLSKTGDWNRFHQLYEDGSLNKIGLSKNTRPYLPKTTPSIDRIASDIKLSLEGTQFNIDTIGDLIKYADSPDSEIGAIPIEPFEKLDQVNELVPGESGISQSTVPAYAWFDPESRKVESDYNDFPILFPKEGNLVTDGRIISPTIDELWEMIKMLASGRNADTANDVTEENAGYPKGEGQYRTTVDTRPTIRHHKLTGDNIGDPLVIDYSMDGDPPSYTVQSWVNNPTKIEYVILSELKALSDEVAMDLEAAKIEQLEAPEEAAPSKKIKSLRELEALYKGLKYNLEYFARFFKRNYTTVGDIGKKSADDIEDWNKTAGSIYQLHRAYNSLKYNEPTTTYDGTKLGTDHSVAPILDTQFGPTQDQIPAHTVFLSAAGTWQSVSQCLNLRIRDDELF